MFYSKDMGEIWHIDILAELTRVQPSEEHINHIKYTKYQEIPTVFGQIMKHRFFTKNSKVNVIFFRSRERVVPQDAHNYMQASIPLE